MKTRQLALAVLIVCLCSSMMVNAGYIGDSGTVMYHQKYGIYPVSYVVEPCNSTFYQSTNASGYVNKSIDASDIINAANTVTHDNGGGIVMIRGGWYTATSSIVVPNGVTDVGEGINVTFLQAASTLHTAIVKIEGTNDGNLHYGGLRDCTLDGSLVVSGTGGEYGLHLYKSKRATFYNVYIHDTWDSGAFIEGTGTGDDESVLNTFYSLFVINCGVGQDNVHSGSTVLPAGLEFTNWTPDNVFFNPNLGANYRCGAYLYSSGNRYFGGGHIWGSVSHPGTYGIYFMVTARDKVEGTEIEHMGRDGIRIYGGSYNSSNSGGAVITGCTINGNSYAVAGSYDGIFLYADAVDCEDITIVGNRIWDRATEGSKTQRYGINFHEVYNATLGLGYIDNLILVGNDFGDNTTTGSASGPQTGYVNMNGTGNEVHHNSGFVLEATGYVTSCMNGTWVAHGVAISPNNFQLMMRGNEYVNSTAFFLPPTVITSNSTHFQISYYIFNVATGIATVVAAADSHTIYWTAEYLRIPGT